MFTSITTSKVRFAYRRLCYKVALPRGIFQRIMEHIAQGMQMTTVYLDDILAPGRTPQQEHDILWLLLGRLENSGLHLSLEKCWFKELSCIFLGHKMTANNIHPTQINLRQSKNHRARRLFPNLESFCDC